MMRKWFAVTVLCSSAGAASQQVPFTDRVEVTASRLPDATASRHVVVFTRDDIARLPVSSVGELLAYLAGAGLARRGANGVQSDVRLRGATFEQVAVLVNGVRVNDPQTGHFHLDVPLPLESVERVEVLLGPGSAVHGPDAFGGVVAITTASAGGPTVRLGGGQHGLFDGRVSIPLGQSAWLAAERTTSQGFRPDTEFAISRTSAGWRGIGVGFDLRIDVGVEGKQFGAWAFYSQAYPDERERTSTGLATLSATRQLGSATLAIKAGARQHRDVFILDRSRPEWYRNRHRTRSALVQATLTGAAEGIGWSVGVEGGRDLIASSALGNHARERTAAFAEATWRRARVTVLGQVRADHATGPGWETSPAVGVSVELGRGITLGAHRGRSFRLPSFTDLYYRSPSTLGDPELEAESGWSDELVFRGSVGEGTWELAGFRRRANDLIDYVAGDDGVYRATNHAGAETRGAEAAFTLPATGPISGARLGVTYLDSSIDVDPSRSRYALTHPRWEIGGWLAASLPLSLDATVGARFRDPVAGDSYALVDARLARDLGRDLRLILEATNLLDRSYQEIDGVPMPGRWVSLAAEWRPHAP